MENIRSIQSVGSDVKEPGEASRPVRTDGGTEPIDAVIEVLPDPCFLVTGDGETIAVTNDEAARLLDRDRDELTNTSIQEYFPPGERSEGMLDGHGEVTVDIGPIEYYQDGRSIAVQRPDGTTVPIKLTVRRLPERQELLVVMQDRSTMRLQDQRRAVAHRLLRHNLRNELTAIQMIGEHLHDVVEDSYVDYVEVLLDACETLLSVADKAHAANRVLDVDEVVVDSVDVAKSIDTIVEEIEASHQDAVIQVDALGGTVHQTVPEAFSESVRNVVENALVHNDSEPPLVSISVSELADGLEVVVEDNGPGIPEHERSVVRTGSESPLEHGSGIGLWLVKWSMNVADGDVFFEDTADGTRVILWFPELDWSVSG